MEIDPRQGVTRRGTAAAIGIAAIGLFQPWAEAAEDPKPFLAVPASPRMLHVAVEIPASFGSPGDTCRLVDPADPNAPVMGQLVPALAAEGDAGAGRLVVADIPPVKGAETSRRFRLERQPAGASSPTDPFRFEDLDGKSLKLVEGGRPVLVYNYGEITADQVPQKDSRRTRGCYIHPVWGLNGEVLTDDFPRDHYHHHGLFWSWPHVGIGGRAYDLWTYRDIRPRFVRWICREAGPVAAVLGVENGWFVRAGETDKRVMTERVWLRVHRACGEERAVDLTLFWIPADQPVTLKGASGKSYGGLTMRFKPADPKRVAITVPEGLTTKDLQMTPLTWADFTATFGDRTDPSGAALFVHPRHPDYPPTWLTRHYGPMCIGWPGVDPKTFAPGKPIRLDYRLVIHKTAMRAEALAQAYETYVTGTRARGD
jgi:hypothetical protein